MRQRGWQWMMVVTALGLGSGLGGYGSAAFAGYKESMDGKCLVWAPSMLDKEDYPVRYSGGCVNGRAEGKGRAEWLYKYAGMKLNKAWDGEFRNGVAIADAALAKKIGKVEPIGGDSYLVEAGNVEDAALTILASSEQSGSMEICAPKQLLLVANASVDLSDDAKVKTITEEGLKAYRALCPKNTQTRSFVKINVYDTPLKLTQNNEVATAPVETLYDWDKNAWGYYQNQVSEQAKRDKQQVERKKMQQERQQNAEAYKKRHGIEERVTVRQLDENPFRWEGKTVGVCVRLSRMLTSDTALVAAGDNRYGDTVQVRGVTPDFPERPAFLVAKVGKREARADKPSGDATYTTLTLIDLQRSETADCSEWPN